MGSKAPKLPPKNRAVRLSAPPPGSEVAVIEGVLCEPVAEVSLTGRQVPETLDAFLEIATREFFKRYERNKPKVIDNSREPAGSPMFYYCSGCFALVAIIPESAWDHSYPQYCSECTPLVRLGMLSRLREEAGRNRKDESRTAIAIRPR